MTVSGDAISLGVEEKSGVNKDGNEYAYCRLNYIIKGEKAVRMYYLPDLKDVEKKQLLFRVATWGIYFKFVGEAISNQIELNTIEPVFD